jgi:predicted metal-dependent hydrolase
LKQRLTSLIGQEAIHSKIHNQFNDEVLKENGYPVELLRAIAEKFLIMVFTNYHSHYNCH